MPTYQDIVVGVEMTPEQTWTALTDPAEWRVWSEIQPQPSVLPLNPDENDQFHLAVRTGEGLVVVRGDVVDADTTRHTLKLHGMIDGNTRNAALVEVRIVVASRTTSRIVVEYRAAGDSAEEDVLQGQYNFWVELLRNFPGRIS